MGNRPSINLSSRRGRLQWTKEWQSRLSDGKNEAEFLTICCKKMQNIWLMDVIYFLRSICLYCETVPRIGQSLGESLWGGKLVKNKWIIKKINEFGFHSMWRIIQMSEDVINHYLGLPPWWITSSWISDSSSHPTQSPSIVSQYFLVLILYTLTKVNIMYNQEQAVRFTKRMSMMVWRSRGGGYRLEVRKEDMASKTVDWWDSST